MEGMKLHGIFPPIATPFDHNGDLYLAKVRYDVEKWNKTQLAGYVVCGSTGESVFLTCQEETRLWEAVREAAAADKLLIAGTGMESVRETVQLGELDPEAVVTPGIFVQRIVRIAPLRRVA